MNLRRAWPPVAASLLVYLAATLVMGRDALQHLSTAAIHDAGDPLLTAAILYWNSIHLPLTGAWWQFPIYYPTPDTLAFSEHLLGLSVIATPIEWLTGDVLATYNIVTLLTFPLSGLAMYALVHRLTRSAPAAFVAGLAYAFAPYRMSQLPHIQMLAMFWAPLALLGLHAYVESGRRRWLVLYAGGWLLQVAANGYTLFFFSLFVALWVLWFVVPSRNWKAFRDITISTVLAVLPLVPILYKYLVVHRRNGFFRSVEEIKLFSADVGAVLCAPEMLTFWGRVRVACRAEGELFPGATVMVLFVIGAALAFGWRAVVDRPAPGRGAIALRRLFGAVALFYLVIAVSLFVFGPWRIELAGIRASATSFRRPISLGIPSLLIVLVLSWPIRQAIKREWTLAFYVVATLAMWLLSLGPSIHYMGHDTGAWGPFLALLQVPGADGLRVPARFWVIAVLGLSVVAGLVMARVSRMRQRTLSGALTAVVAVAILADGWVTTIPVVDAPVLPVPAVTLAGRTVLDLPIGDTLDIPATYFAATGNWVTLNGYSGYHPSYYPALNYSIRFEEGTAFEAFRAMGDLDVLVASRNGRLRTLLEAQPEVRVITQNERAIHYVLPRRGDPRYGDVAGTRLAVSGVSTSCAARLLPLATDARDDTRWVCGPENAAHSVLVDLGRVVTAGAVVNGIGRFNADFPPALRVETSTDGSTWQSAWDGSLLGQAIRAGIRSPGSQRIVIPFTPRQARYIRLTHPAAADYYWSIAELEVWAGNTN